LEVVTTDDRVDIGVLGEVDGVAFMVTTDFDAEKPVELTESVISTCSEIFFLKFKISMIVVAAMVQSST
jgi:hypothetical protein